MNCSEYDKIWNDLIDARGEGPVDLERHLEAHAATCPPCRSAAARYLVLGQALAALEPPAPSADSSRRLIEALVESRRPARRRSARLRVLAFAIPMASAAALLLLAWPAIRDERIAQEAAKPIAVRPSSAPPARPLDLALADARVASIELAREASAPAARIGRELLGDRDGREQPPSADPPGDVPANRPAGLLQAVGEQVNSGVRPIPGLARHAFSFLLGPPPPAAQDSL